MQCTNKIFVFSEPKRNTKRLTFNYRPTLKINVLWAALPNMPCKPRCHFGFLHLGLPACWSGLSIPTENLSVCVSTGIDSSCLYVPHLLHCHVYLASVGIFLDSFKDIQHKQTLWLYLVGEVPWRWTHWDGWSCFSCLAHLLNQNRSSDIMMAYPCHISSGLRLLNPISFCLGTNFNLWEHNWTHKPNLHKV